MRAQKIFSALFIMALMFISITAAQAQESGAAELRKRIREQITSGARTQPVRNSETAGPQERENKAAPDSQADRSAEAATQITETTAQQNGLPTIIARLKDALIGAWDLTLTFSDGSQVKSTLSVFPGRTNGEGTIIHAAEASLLLPNPTTPEQGAWRHNGGLQFIASYRGYAVDEKFEKPFGTIGFRHAITLNADQESFTGHAVFEVIDAEGNVLFSDTVQTRGVRQHALAP
ncbi:MAG: hypothetical protein U0Z53_14610 [Blastocatellia bacterium]